MKCRFALVVIALSLICNSALCQLAVVPSGHPNIVTPLVEQKLKIWLTCRLCPEVREEIQSTLNREFRSLGTVEIVEPGHEYDYHVDITMICGDAVTPYLFQFVVTKPAATLTNSSDFGLAFLRETTSGTLKAEHLVPIRRAISSSCKGTELYVYSAALRASPGYIKTSSESIAREVDSMVLRGTRGGIALLPESR